MLIRSRIARQPSFDILPIVGMLIVVSGLIRLNVKKLLEIFLPLMTFSRNRTGQQK